MRLRPIIARTVGVRACLALAPPETWATDNMEATRPATASTAAIPPLMTAPVTAPYVAANRWSV